MNIQMKLFSPLLFIFPKLYLLPNHFWPFANIANWTFQIFKMNDREETLTLNTIVIEWTYDIFSNQNIRLVISIYYFVKKVIQYNMYVYYFLSYLIKLSIPLTILNILNLPLMITNIILPWCLHALTLFSSINFCPRILSSLLPCN